MKQCVMMCVPMLFAILLQVFICTAGSTTIVNNQHYEGRNCILENGNEGICKILTECSSGRENSASSGQCGAQNSQEVVCCPKNTIKLRRAAPACGDKSDFKKSPYIVDLGYPTDPDSDIAEPIVYRCRGTLISRQRVLTTAHCVKNLNEVVPIHVRIRDAEAIGNVTDAQIIPISEIILNPQYTIRTNYHDLAILKLQRETTSKPLCLETTNLHAANMAGGNTKLVAYDNLASNRLLDPRYVNFVSRQECNKSYNDTRRLPDGINESIICTLDQNDTRVLKDCQGIAGSPLLLMSGDDYSVVGISSFGRGCGLPYPDGHASIYPSLNWIQEKM